jgi:hypothetical protein
MDPFLEVWCPLVDAVKEGNVVVMVNEQDKDAFFLVVEKVLKAVMMKYLCSWRLLRGFDEKTWL